MLAVWIIGASLFLATVGFFIGQAAARGVDLLRARRVERFQAECDAAVEEVRRSLRLRGRVPVSDRWAA